MFNFIKETKFITISALKIWSEIKKNIKAEL